MPASRLAAGLGLVMPQVEVVEMRPEIIAYTPDLAIQLGLNSLREWETAISECIVVPNEQPKPFVRPKSADAILTSIGRFASRILAVQGTNNV